MKIKTLGKIQINLTLIKIMIQCLYMLKGLEFTLEGDIVKDSQWEGLTGTNNVIPESFEKNDSFQKKIIKNLIRECKI